MTEIADLLRLSRDALVVPELDTAALVHRGARALAYRRFGAGAAVAIAVGAAISINVSLHGASHRSAFAVPQGDARGAELGSLDAPAELLRNPLFANAGAQVGSPTDLLAKQETTAGTLLFVAVHGANGDCWARYLQQDPVSASVNCPRGIPTNDELDVIRDGGLKSLPGAIAGSVPGSATRVVITGPHAAALEIKTFDGGTRNGGRRYFIATLEHQGEVEVEAFDASGAVIARASSPGV